MPSSEHRSVQIQTQSVSLAEIVKHGYHSDRDYVTKPTTKQIFILMRQMTNFPTHEVAVTIKRICYDEEEGGHNCFLSVAMTQLHKL